MNESGTKSLAWNENTVYAVGLYRLVSRSIGIWPLECDNFGAKIRFLIVIALQLSLNYSLIQEFANGCVSIADVHFIGVLGTTTVSLLKVSMIRMHREDMKCLVESVINDWGVSRDDGSIEIMRSYANIGRMVSILQFGSAYFSAVIIIICAPPTVNEITQQMSTDSNLTTTALRNLPMGSGCSVVDASIFMYLATYIFQLIQMLCLVNCFMGCDTLLFGISMHVCAQFELLKIRITRLGLNHEQTQFRNEFADLIQRHNHLVHMVDLMEHTFHLTILGQLCSSSLHIGLLGIQLLFQLQDGDYVGMMYSSIAISSLLFQIYLYSYAGEYLTSMSMEIRDAAYDCCWYDFSPSFARGILLTIVRTNHPSHITAGKMYNMNNQSFTSFVKTMATFFSFLKLTIFD